MRQRFGIAQALLGDPDLLIVDEPTAGLDPEERNRFHNLLVSLGEEKVIILSTHIVDDVSELCHRMAVLAGGEILLEGNPILVTDTFNGRIWRKTVSLEEADALSKEMSVISKRLLAGRTVVHVLADAQPEGFEAIPANLEDVYFSTLHQSRTAAAADAA
jgi:ABC-type multidrug transport system ATPase subunit